MCFVDGFRDTGAAVIVIYGNLEGFWSTVSGKNSSQDIRTNAIFENESMTGKLAGNRLSLSVGLY